MTPHSAKPAAPICATDWGSSRPILFSSRANISEDDAVSLAHHLTGLAQATPSEASIRPPLYREGPEGNPQAIAGARYGFMA